MEERTATGRQGGITLLECLVVVTVLALSLALGSGPLRDFRDRNRLAAQVARFVSAINIARSEAVMRNQAVSICPSPVASTGSVGCAGTYAGGWMVFANRDRDKDVDEASDAVLKVFEGLPHGFTLTNSSGERDATGLINYLPDGSSRSNRTLLFCPPPGSQVSPASIVINMVGRPRVVHGEGRCPGVRG